MSKSGAVDEYDWSLEARKQLIKGIPNNVYDCVQKLVEYSSKAGAKEPPGLQASIDQYLLQFTPDRKFANPLSHFKVLNYLASTFICDLKTQAARKTMFNCIFLGREVDALKNHTSHNTRVALLNAFTSLALQYPMYFHFTFVTEYLLSNENNLKYALGMVADICNNFILRPQDWNLGEFVETLDTMAFEFCALILLYSYNKEYENEPHHKQLVSILGRWLNRHPGEFLKFYSNHPFLAQEFSIKRFPLMLEFNCTNGKNDDAHDRFHVGIVKLIMASADASIKIPLDLSSLLNIQTGNNNLNGERKSECIFVAKTTQLIS